MLKVSAFYLEKQKSFIPKENIFLAVVSKYAKRDPKDGVFCPNFQRRFCYSRKNCTKPNPNRIAVQLNLWKLCISAKSQKQLVLQSLNFHIWHRVLIHIGKFGDSTGLFSAFRNSNKCKTKLQFCSQAVSYFANYLP